MSTRTQTWEVALCGQTLLYISRPVRAGALSLVVHETNWEAATGEILRCDLAR